MAKTIKEMAALAFPTIGDDDKEAIEALKYIGIKCDNACEYNSVRLNQQDIYIMGANAVLEKVEEILNKTESKIGKLGRIAELELLVYELKGE